jgi:hypothetical protein|tara:strand:+ start:42 stop:323 length:282 start_codon:yes stop_codon:yes gene_type:complete
MASLEQLRREKQKLLNQAQARREIAQIGRERNQLKKEVRDLRNPKTAVFKRNLSSGLRAGGRATFRFLDRITEPAPVRRRTIKKSPIRRKRRK